MALMKKKAWLWIGFLLTTPFWAGAGEYDAGVQGKIIIQTEKTSNGDPVTYLKTRHPKVTAMTVDISPGAKTGWHSHPVPVYAYVASGRLTVEIEGSKTKEFKEGDAIIEVLNVRHNGINYGSVPVRLVVFYTGGKGIPNVIKADKP